MTSVRLPKIGTVKRNNNGSFDVGPLPVIGGPFGTATAFLEAWAAHAKFPTSDDVIRQRVPHGLVTAMLSSIKDFPLKLKAMAGRISAHDSGPFPLCHRDFYHSNIVI